QILDVDAPVPEGAALLVRFGDLRLERDDSFEPGYEVGHLAAPCEMGDRWCCGWNDHVSVRTARPDASGGSAVTLRGLTVRDVIPVMPGWWSPNRISASTISLS